MKCKCGYEGLAEIGNFPDESCGGKYKNLPYMNVRFRCPVCKSNKKMEHINSIDSIRHALLFGEFCTRNHQRTRRVVEFVTSYSNKSFVGYSISCPVCMYGEASGITPKEYANLIKEAEEGKFILIQKDADVELKKLGIC